MDPDFIRELFSQFRPVTIKRMFGGAGIYAEGFMFALVFDDAIYLRVNEASIPSFEREGSVPLMLSCAAGRRTFAIYPLAKNHVGRPSRHFWRLPERLYDDPDELSVWAGRALAIAEHRKVAPRGPIRKKPPSKNPARRR